VDRSVDYCLFSEVSQLDHLPKQQVVSSDSPTKIDASAKGLWKSHLQFHLQLRCSTQKQGLQMIQPEELVLHAFWGAHLLLRQAAHGDAAGDSR